ncbi:MAG: hypothetical protein L6R42_007106, partial [Xanthoria sp. 1 TBL-2021]
VTWLLTSNKDTQDRATYIIDMALAILTGPLLENPQGSLSEASKIAQSWKSKANSLLVETYINTRTEFFTCQNTSDYLGCASKRMYLFVRKTLGVPFNKGLEDHPTPQEPIAADGSRKQTIGSWIGIIYESLRNGQLHEPLMECLAEAGLVAGVSPVDKPVTNEVIPNGNDSVVAHTNDSVHQQSINDAVQRLSISESPRKDSIEDAVRKHSIDVATIAEDGEQRASLSPAHGSLTSL